MRSPRSLLAALGIAMIVVGALPMAAHARYGHEIDLSLSRYGRPTVGAGESSRDPSAQTMHLRVRSYDTERVTLGILKKYQSISPVPARIHGCENAGRLQVRYRVDHVDVSEAVKDGDFRTEALRRGQRVSMGVAFTARGRLLGDTSCVIRSGQFDAVRIVVSGR
jgi:hypothetical protein